MPYRWRSSSTGRAPLSSAEAKAAQPALVIGVQLRLSCLSFVSTPVGGDSAPAGGGGCGATRAARPSSPNGLLARVRDSSVDSRRKAGARATSPASPTPLQPASLRTRILSRGRAPRPSAAASAEAPASPTCMFMRDSWVTEGSAFAPSPSNSRCTPSGPAAPAESSRRSTSSAGSTETSDHLRLAQPLAAPHSHLAAQQCGKHVTSPQLLQKRLRQRPQLAVGAAKGHGDAWIEHVAQLAEDDALLVTAQLRQRHRGDDDRYDDTAARSKQRGVNTGYENAIASQNSSNNQWKQTRIDVKKQRWSWIRASRASRRTFRWACHQEP
eukprot:scaffold65836_cov54-Phaeocystis_antarctica.AAC.3